MNRLVFMNDEQSPPPQVSMRLRVQVGCSFFCMMKVIGQPLKLLVNCSEI